MVASANEYATVASSEELEASQTHRPRKRSRLSRLPLPASLLPKPRFFIAAIMSLGLISLYTIFRPHRYFTSGDIALVASDNPYFQTGDVWDHNKEVAARLDRCESLGLLRNTSLPQAPLSQEEEEELIAEGCGTNQTTLIILSSLYMAEAFSGASTFGETIYAQSVISTLNAYNYAYMFSNLGWYNPDMKKTVEIFKQYRWNTRMVLADPDQIDTCWRHNGGPCLKDESNPEGIEAWRLLSFWYWDDPGTPLGPSFTLSPVPNNPNHFLSYSIEPTCRRIPSLHHTAKPTPPRAYLLAKQIHYLENSTAFSWTLPALSELQKDLGINVVAGLKNDRPELKDDIDASGIIDLGVLDKMTFYAELAKAFVFVGVGRPRISPSPWDALCMGVPFINPILTWDESQPNNKSSWHAQQWHMIDLSPPYVYPVHAHNITELNLAVKSAMDNPIESFIPDYMRFEFVRERMAEVVEGDWLGKAKGILKERREIGGDVFLL